MSTKSLAYCGLAVAFCLLVLSGQACPPNGDDMMPAPEPVPGPPGPPGTDATVTAGDGVTVDNGVVSLDINFTDGLYWKLGGNATTATQVLGTLGDAALEFIVNGVRALRLEPNGSRPNIIGGSSANTVDDGVVAATIAGGGPSDPNDPNTANRVTDDFGTIGGGQGNTASTSATVGGGKGNTASGVLSTVGGGFDNEASGSRATVAGGEQNTASGSDATVGGGEDNIARSTRDTVGGGGANEATGGHSTVAGGDTNTASGTRSTVGGGEDNIASGPRSTVGGGFDNEALAPYATIAGGGRTDILDGTTRNRVTDRYGTIGGGGNNQAGDDDGDTTNATFATVGGGESNTASGSSSTVGGGQSNEARAIASTVGGGEDNRATTSWTTVSGGRNNIASFRYSTIPGGRDNQTSAEYSFAAGRRAFVVHTGAFVWGDSTDANVLSTNFDSFTVRASGGTTFYSSSDLSTGVELEAGDGAWSSLSDRNVKENFERVDGRRILERLAAILIETWNYKTQEDSIRHMGPMAQDFHAAFGVGHDDKRISTIDADGVALAAIQGLHQLVQEKDAALSIQRRRIDKLEARLADLEMMVTKFASTKAPSRR